MSLVIYVDGSCLGNPGKGGWAAALYANGVLVHQMSGGEKHTTNNRMELTAPIRALSVLSGSCEVIIYTDSNYVKQGITDWLPKWKARNWKKSDGKPVLNADLWMELDQISSRHRIHWNWIKAHNGDPGNEYVDGLAREAARSQ